MGWCCGTQCFHVPITSISFNAPLKPGQDWSACIYARLLGPCFKTGRIDCRSTDRRIISHYCPRYINGTPRVNRSMSCFNTRWRNRSHQRKINWVHLYGLGALTLHKQRFSSNVNMIQSVTNKSSQAKSETCKKISGCENFKLIRCVISTPYWYHENRTNKLPSHISRGLSTRVRENALLIQCGHSYIWCHDPRAGKELPPNLLILERCKAFITSIWNKPQGTTEVEFSSQLHFVVLSVSLQAVSRPFELSLQSTLQLSLTVLVCYRYYHRI